MIESTQPIPCESLLCPCCGFELRYQPGNIPTPGSYYGCVRCGGAIQAPTSLRSAIWFERVPDESVIPLRVANKLHELRGNLRHRGALQ